MSARLKGGSMSSAAAGIAELVYLGERLDGHGALSQRPDMTAIPNSRFLSSCFSLPHSFSTFRMGCTSAIPTFCLDSGQEKSGQELEAPHTRLDLGRTCRLCPRTHFSRTVLQFSCGR